MKTTPHLQKLACLGLLPLLIIGLHTAQAGSATWDLNPTSGDWNTATNWTPATVPNGLGDSATFGVSNTTAVSLSASVQVFSLIFSPGASAYTITSPSGTILTLSGLTNNSGITQEFVATQGGTAAGGVIHFSNGSAPALCHFTIQGGNIDINQGFPSPRLEFHGVSNGGSATFDLEAAVLKSSDGSHAEFYDSASAGAGTFIIHANSKVPADMLFTNSSSAGSATITGEGAAFANAVGGSLTFTDTSSAGTSTITVNGGLISTALLGVIQFAGSATAGSATLIANGGVGQGGAVRFSTSSTGGTARIMLNGNGYMDNSQEFLPSVTIGSLEGQGPALLGSRNLTVGNNSLSTTYSGIIQDGGLSGGTGSSLTKVGSGTLTLTGASTYTGGTTVNAGALAVVNRRGSATGTGAVQVNGGQIGGRGIIAGAVTIGTGGGAGATLMPEIGSSRQVTTVMQSSLTFKSDATYSCRANTSRGSADTVVANGVAISGGRFAFKDQRSAPLPSGTIFTVIQNIAATPIAGTFSNLADGSTLTAGSNTYAVSYEGGDGNDLTLTVVP